VRGGARRNGKKSDLVAVSKVVAAVVGSDGRLVRPLGAPHRLPRRCQCSPFVGAAATFLGETRARGTTGEGGSEGGAVRGGQPVGGGEGSERTLSCSVEPGTPHSARVCDPFIPDPGHGTGRDGREGTETEELASSFVKDKFASDVVQHFFDDHGGTRTTTVSVGDSTCAALTHCHWEVCFACWVKRPAPADGRPLFSDPGLSQPFFF
jgi:hypothetical protein